MDLHRYTLREMSCQLGHAMCYLKNKRSKNYTNGNVYGAKRLPQNYDISYRNSPNFLESYFLCTPSIQRPVNGIVDLSHILSQ